MTVHCYTSSITSTLHYWSSPVFGGPHWFTPVFGPNRQSRKQVRCKSRARYLFLFNFATSNRQAQLRATQTDTDSLTVTFPLLSLPRLLVGRIGSIHKRQPLASYTPQQRDANRKDEAEKKWNWPLNVDCPSVRRRRRLSRHVSPLVACFSLTPAEAVRFATNVPAASWIFYFFSSF